jgi:hypothetical protein
MQRLARPVAPLEEAEHDPSGVFQSGFAPLLHTDPRLLALSFASALLTDYGGRSAWRQLGAWDSRHDC